MMTFDFPMILVLATFVTGFVWLLDAIFWAPKRRNALSAAAAEGPAGEGAAAKKTEAEKIPYFVELSRSFFPVILAVLVIRSFIVEPFRIPSASMMPTLHIGDFILVNKFAYGLRLPVLNTKILSTGTPQRGDVIVFRYPDDTKIDFIKRVVGVPGDTVSYHNRVVYINGVAQKQDYLGTYIGQGAEASMTGASVEMEHLGKVDHRILLLPNGDMRDFQFTIPSGQYFVMGDNRDNSRDSRYWGTVPDSDLVGKAFLIWMNWDPEVSHITWSRIGSRIK